MEAKESEYPAGLLTDQKAWDEHITEIHERWAKSLRKAGWTCIQPPGPTTPNKHQEFRDKLRAIGKTHSAPNHTEAEKPAPTIAEVSGSVDFGMDPLD